MKEGLIRYVSLDDELNFYCTLLLPLSKKIVNQHKELTGLALKVKQYW